MKTSAVSNGKAKGPRVLANTIKKSERSLNSSGFLNKSISSRYIADLRSNNAKLAHALATQKKQSAEWYKSVSEMQEQNMAQKALLRTCARSMKDSMGKFKSAIDLLFDASSTLSADYEKILRYCPEADEPAAMLSASRNLGRSDCSPNRNVTATVTANIPSASTFSSNSGSTLPLPQGTAMPMVQGQVISHPTISLQRVVVPTRNLGKAVVKPDRGVQWLSIDTANDTRLSAVLEESNISNRSDASFLSNTSPVASVQTVSSPNPPTVERNLDLSLPAPRVVLEQLSPHHILNRSVSSPHLVGGNDDDEENQLTAVNFGSINFTGKVEGIEPLLQNVSLRFSTVSSPKRPSYVPSRESGDRNQSNFKLSSTEATKPTLNSSTSDDYVTDSSSEDEELALQIVESKKYYLAQRRQADSKEGTSWNYDDAGKFREKPPKRKKRRKSAGGSKVSRKLDTVEPNRQQRQGMALTSVTKSLETRKCSPPTAEPLQKKERVTQRKAFTLKREATDRKEGKTPDYVQPNNMPAVNVLLSSSGQSADLQSTDSGQNADVGINILSNTVLEEQDMSFTACITTLNAAHAPVAVKEICEENIGIEKNERESTAINKQLCDRGMYVTKRSRGRKPSCESVPPEEREPNATSPMTNVSKKTIESLQENIENSPPIARKRCVLDSNNCGVDSDQQKAMATYSESSSYQDLSQFPSYVVLERLPKNIISGNCNENTSSDLDNSKKTKMKKSSSKENECISKSEPPDCDVSLQNTSVMYFNNNEVLVSRKRSHAVSSKSKILAGGDQVDQHCESADTLPKPRVQQQTKRTSKSLKSPNKKSVAKKNSSDFNSSKKSVPNSPQSSCSAPSSPHRASSRRDFHSSLDDDSDVGTHRPRRNAAPTCFKEPKMNTKMRRP